MDVSVGTRLRVLRKDAGLTQAQLAALAGTNQAAINRYETDRAAAPYRILVWYATYFNVSLDYIFGLCENPPRTVCLCHAGGGAGGGAAQTGLERVRGSLLHAGQRAESAFEADDPQYGRRGKAQVKRCTP